MRGNGGKNGAGGMSSTSCDEGNVQMSLNRRPQYASKVKFLKGFYIVYQF